MSQAYEDIIRIISQTHCARGPTRCQKCKEAAKNRRICLLRTYEDDGRVARPVIQLSRDGRKVYRVYDVLRSFSNEPEALEFAEKNEISDVDLS